MTREEEIEQQTFVYYETCSDEDIAKSKGFIDGAKWADQHPRKGLVDIEKVIQYMIKNSRFKYLLETDWEVLDDLRKAMEE